MRGFPAVTSSLGFYIWKHPIPAFGASWAPLPEAWGGGQPSSCSGQAHWLTVWAQARLPGLNQKSRSLLSPEGLGGGGVEEQLPGTAGGGPYILPLPEHWALCSLLPQQRQGKNLLCPKWQPPESSSSPPSIPAHHPPHHHYPTTRTGCQCLHFLLQEGGVLG